VPRIFAALARHGHYDQLAEVPSAHQPQPLSAQGVRQALALAEELLRIARDQGVEIHPVIDSSPILCAFQSADVAARELERSTGASFVVEQFDTLSERCLGPMANLTIAEIERALARDLRHPSPPARWWLRSDYRLPYSGAESLLDAGQRVAHHLVERSAQLAREVERDTLKLFVGHAGAFRHSAVVLGVLELSAAQTLSMHHGRILLLEQERDKGFRHVGGDWKPRESAPIFD
jgi:2,3-bisphosphoglycerate-dependent phosphoglycerate mutase